MTKYRTGLPLWRIAGAVSALLFAAVTLSVPAQAYSSTRYPRAHPRRSHARVYAPPRAVNSYARHAPAPGVVNTDNSGAGPGYNCPTYNIPFPCEPNR
jgi:hypothetical protein